MAKLQPYFLSFAKWLQINYKLIILSCVLACLSFPKYDLSYASGIDEPLPWIFNYFADGHFNLGINTIFPHGPLAFLLYPVQIGNNLWVTIFINLICSILLSMSLFKISKLTQQENYPLLTVIIMLVLSLADIQLQLICLTFCFVIIYHLSEKKINLLFALFFGVFNLFIKSYGGIICGLILLSLVIHLILLAKNFKLALQIFTVYFLLFFLFWFSIYGTLSGSIMFLRGQINLSTDNSEAVLFNQENNWWLIGLSILSLFSIPIITKNKLTRYVFFLMLLPLFGAWKHAMARGEEIHLGSFFSILLIFILMIWAICNEKNVLVTIFCLISTGTFYLSISIHEDYSEHKNVGLFKTFNLYHLVQDYDSISVQKKRYSRDNFIWRRKFLPDSIKKLIGKNTVDVFPWNYAYIPANNFNWQPRPVIQSYASYTSWLDEQNSAHIASKKSAQFYIWDLNDMDGNGTTSDGIDGRYILNDEPKTIINFFANYSLKIKTNDYLIYEKLSNPLEVNKSSLSTSHEINYNEWVNVPEADKNSITRAKLKIKKSFLGKLKSLVYKGELFYVYYECENKKIYSHRFVPKNAEDGIWLNPVCFHPENEFEESPIKKIRISCSNQNMVNKTFELEFEQISFKNKSDSKTFLNAPTHCFNKLKSTASETLFFTTHESNNPSNDSVRITSTKNCLSPDGCFELKPGKSVGFFSCKTDTSKVSSGVNPTVLFFEAFVKANKQSNATIIISQNKKILAQQSIKGFIVEGNNFWNSVHLSQLMHYSQVDLNQPFQLYIKNDNSGQKIYVDGMSATINEFKQ